MNSKTFIQKCILFLSLVFTLLIIFCSCSLLTTERSIKNTKINPDGDLIIYYTDGTYQNLGRVVGEDGKDGIDGKDGEPGANGKNGVAGKDGNPGTDGKDGVITIVGGDESIALATSKGLRSTVSVICGFSNLSTGELYTSRGAGVILNFDKATGSAYIITNYHVVYDSNASTYNKISDDIKVLIYGSEYSESVISATYLGGTMYYDLAVLKVTNSDILKGSDVVAATINSSSSIIPGQDAIAIGNPNGDGISSTYGIISKDSEYIEMYGADNKTPVEYRVMRIDTAVNSGNSGGGLFDKTGNLIGIVNAKYNDTKVENISYAIPSDIVQAVYSNIIYHCDGISCTTLQRALLGVTVTASNSSGVFDSETGYMSIQENVIISSVDITSPAFFDLKENDVVTKIVVGEYSKEVTRMFHLIDTMLNAKVGDTITMYIERNGIEMNFSYTVTNEMVISY